MAFIKLDKNIQNWKWYTKENMLLVWIDLLTSASFKDNYFDGKLIKKGQVVIGRKKLAEKLHLSEQAIRTCLKRLKSTGEITIETTNKYSVVTIVKWADYQAVFQHINQQNSQGINHPVTSKQPANNQQVTTTKEIKEVLEDKESFINNINNACVSPFMDVEEQLQIQEQELTDMYNSPLFDLYEQGFGRPLSQREIQTICQWTKEYEDRLIRYALREALTYNKQSIDYVDRTLLKWKQRGFTAEQYEEGER